MDKFLFHDEPVARRAQLLHDNCRKVVENETYTRQLTKEELEEEKQALFEEVRIIDNLKKELKEHTKSEKDKIKHHEGLRKQSTEAIAFEAKEETGDLYMIDYQEEGMMAYYNPQGFLVKSRPLQPSERQLSIMTTKTGTR